jgi:hypothetical protein
MKYARSFTILFALLYCGHTYSFGGSVTFSERDSLPDQQTALRFRARHFAVNNEQPRKQMLTLLIQPGNTASAREVALPIGTDIRTISVISGDELLHVEKDYVFLPTTNRLRILNENALNAKLPIRIAYEHPNLTISTVSH